VALFTTDEFKALEGIPAGVTAHDALIALLATRVTDFINRYLNRTIEAADYVEERDGNNRVSLRVSNPPINTVASLKVTLDGGFAGVASLAAGDYVFDKAGIVTLRPNVVLGIFRDRAIFPAGIRNIEIQYNGGFTVVPTDLAQAGMMLASAWFNRRRHGGIRSLTSGSVSVAFQSKDLPDESRRAINLYRIYPMMTGSNL
jgi:hypothetical protein